MNLKYPIYFSTGLSEKVSEYSSSHLIVAIHC